MKVFPDTLLTTFACISKNWNPTVGGGVKMNKELGAWTKLLNFFMHGIFSTPGYEASGAFYRIDISFSLQKSMLKDG